MCYFWKIFTNLNIDYVLILSLCYRYVVIVKHKHPYTSVVVPHTSVQ